ncbi:hypothetical protein HQQ81_05300 [Microbacteriaceae bacterium VKM Ac-2854]|nr:hypothetical protein [Microbacteriaceae bacterium VKM Ac-2854]
MDVIVSRSGGFAGLRRTWRVELDQQPDEPAWLDLIDELPWNAAPTDQPAHADRFVYEIRVSTHHVRISETQLSGPWRELVDRVKEAQQPG